LLLGQAFVTPGGLDHRRRVLWKLGSGLGCAGRQQSGEERCVEGLGSEGQRQNRCE
jgi:hypothetical protein